MRGESISRLETFVDAAFAFAVTMMVISVGSVPQSTADLLAALHKAPTMAVCFLIMMIFWGGHNRWSRRYGLDNARTTWLSMLLVLGVLVWVYPQRIVLSCALAFMTGQWVPAEVHLETTDELQNLFLVYGLGFGLLNAVLLLLHLEAQKHADELSLDSLERLETKREIRSYWIMLAIALASIVLTFTLRGVNTIWASSPGFAYMLIGPAMHFHHARFHKLRKALPPRLA